MISTVPKKRYGPRLDKSRGSCYSYGMHPIDDPKNYEPTQEYPLELLEWVVKTIKALNEVRYHYEDHGAYGLPDVLPIVFDGDYTTGLAIARSEHSDEYVFWTTKYVDPVVD